MIKLNPDERLLIESWVNHYHLVGPGLILLKPWQKAITKLDVGPQMQPFEFEGIRTVENVPVKITLEVLYCIDPALLTADLLPKVPDLNQGVWLGILKWRTEQVLRRTVTNQTWHDLDQVAKQKQLERHLTETLIVYSQSVGLNILAVCLVKIEFPDSLQRTIVQAERDSVAPRGRVLVLKEYADIFGSDLIRAMPYIVQWELLNILHKSGNPQLLLTSSAPVLNGQPYESGSSQPVYQIQLPQPHRET